MRACGKYESRARARYSFYIMPVAPIAPMLSYAAPLAHGNCGHLVNICPQKCVWVPSYFIDTLPLSISLPFFLSSSFFSILRPPPLPPSPLPTTCYHAPRTAPIATTAPIAGHMPTACAPIAGSSSSSTAPMWSLWLHCQHCAHCVPVGTHPTCIHCARWRH